MTPDPLSDAEPELMYKLCDEVCEDLNGVISALEVSGG